MRISDMGLGRLIVLASTVYILVLAFNNELRFYIHPRYIVFTVVMAIISLFVLILGSTNSDHTHDKYSPAALVPVILILVTAIVVPASSLSSATVSQRSVDSGSVVNTLSSKPISSLFLGSSKGLSLSDWSRILPTNDQAEYYANKPASVSGFVYDAGLGPDEFRLARFIVTCCAVDAQPVGIPVFVENWQDQFGQDQWLQIEGEFKQTTTNGNSKIMLVPTSIEKIEEPSNPYAN